MTANVRIEAGSLITLIQATGLTVDKISFKKTSAGRRTCMLRVTKPMSITLADIVAIQAVFDTTKLIVQTISFEIEKNVEFIVIELTRQIDP